MSSNTTDSFVFLSKNIYSLFKKPLQDLNNLLTKTDQGLVIVFSLKKGDEEMELFDSIVESFGNILTNLSTPMFAEKPVSRFALNAAQKATAVKVGVAFLGVASLSAGAALVAKAWKASYSLRKEIEILKPPSLQPELKIKKETIANPIHLLGRIKLVFNKNILPLMTGIFSLAGSAFVFSRFDKLLKAIK